MSKPDLFERLLGTTEELGRLRERVYNEQADHRETKSRLFDARNDIRNLEARIKDLESAKPPTQFTLQVPTEAPVSLSDSWVTVKCTLHTDRKIDMIKSMRILTGLGLKEAKDFVEGTPTKIYRHMFTDLCGADFQERFPSTFTVVE